MRIPVKGVPIPTNRPVGQPGPDEAKDVKPNLLFCRDPECVFSPDGDGLPVAWLAYDLESKCPRCGSKHKRPFVTCGAHTNPMLCRNAASLRKRWRRCELHGKLSNRRGPEHHNWKGGVTMGRRLPFRIPDAFAADVGVALDADREGLRPHAALLDARISAALDDLVAGAAGRGAALTRAKAALAREDDDEDSAAEVRAALLGLVEAASDDAAEARLVRLVAERRKLEVAQARVEQSALDVPLATVALVGEMLRGFGRAQERVLAAAVGRVLTADDLVTLRQATARELDEAGAVGGRSTTRHASDSYLSGWGGEVVIDGEADGGDLRG